jgi:hypothetical protein
MRLPLRTLSPERFRQLEAALDAFGWDDVRCK